MLTVSWPPGSEGGTGSPLRRPREVTAAQSRAGTEVRRADAPVCQNGQPEGFLATGQHVGHEAEASGCGRNHGVAGMVLSGAAGWGGSESLGHVGVTTSTRDPGGRPSRHSERILRDGGGPVHSGERLSPGSQGEVPAGSRGAGPGSCGANRPGLGGQEATLQAVWRQGLGAVHPWGPEGIWSLFKASNPPKSQVEPSLLSPHPCILVWRHSWHPPQLYL